MDERPKIKDLYKALHDVCIAVNTSLEIDAMMAKIVSTAAEAIGCESSLIAILENDRWIVKYLYRLPPEMAGNFFCQEDSLAGTLAGQAPKCIHIDSAQSDPRILSGMVKELGVRSSLAVPLTVSGNIPGILLLNYHSRTVSLEDDEMFFADRMGVILSLALRNSWLLERSIRSETQVRRAKEFSDALNSINALIHSSLDCDEIMRKVVREAARAIDAGSAMIYMRENNAWQAHYVYGLPGEVIGRKLTEEEVKYSVLATKEKRSIVINDAPRDSRVRRDIIEAYGIRAILDVALTIGNELLGDFALHYHVPGKTFDEQTVDFVNKVASSLTLALKNARLYEQRQAILEVLRESEQRFRSAFDYAAFGTLITDPGGQILQVNHSLCRMLGYPEAELLRKTFQDLTHPDDLAASLALQDDLEKGRREYGWLEKRYIHRDGHTLWAVLSVAVIRDAQGKPLYFVSQMQDVTDRKQAEEALRKSETKLSAILRNTPAAVYLLDADGRFDHVNQRFEELFGISSEGVLGKSAYDLFPADVAEPLMANNRLVMKGRSPIEFEERIPKADGTHIYASVKSPLMDGSGRTYAVVGISTDITERKKMEDEIRHLANHDSLTGLPNRRFFLDIIELEIAQARRKGTKLAVLFLDLDRFKEVNDTLGHVAGDELLKEVAVRLRSNIRASDTIARMGGDEFNFLLPDIARSEDITFTIRKIMEAFHPPFLIAGQELHITGSVGVSIYPDDSEEIGTLFRYADIALYQSKDLGKNSYYFYNPAINLRSIERIKLESSLRQSLDRAEIEVFYQPQINLRSGRIVAAEALVRWRHPERGMLDPKWFISSAEDTGFITAIDEYVLRAACAQIRTWLDSGVAPVCIAVNLSAREFQNPELVNNILSILNRSGTPPEYLDVEITETLAMSNIERTIARLTELAEAGVHVSIDDFGTGYSSLNYLKQLPIQKLKIDQSFVKDIVTNADDRTIINAVTAMAHAMGIKVLAEGVETAEQLAFLNTTECDEIQGFFFSRPVPAHAFGELMKAGK